MAYVIAAPEMMTAAATDLATIGSDLGADQAAVAARTVALVPAAADEVSASVAHLFSQHAQGYQALAGQAAAFHEQFVQNLKSSAASFTSIEADIASFLKGLNADGTNLLVSLFGPGFAQTTLLQFILGIGLFFILLPVDLLFLILLPFLAVLAAA
jgi:hypothetical protein